MLQQTAWIARSGASLRRRGGGRERRSARDGGAGAGGGRGAGGGGAGGGGAGGGGAGGAGGDGGGAETPPNNSQIKRTLQYNQGQMEDLRREQKQISADMHTVLKTLEAGQLVFQELENLKDKASRELRHQMGGLK